MSRPLCPCCNRTSVVTNSHPSGEWRVRYFGCIRCRVWSLGSDLIPLAAKRTRAVISILRRTASGQFAKSV